MEQAVGGNGVDGVELALAKLRSPALARTPEPSEVTLMFGGYDGSGDGNTDVVG
jgi:hypothetical protein